MLWRALKHVVDGFYIDVSAARPQKSSVTKAFYEHGWRGINIAADLAMWQLLEAERARDINLRQALSDQPGAWTFAKVWREHVGTRAVHFLKIDAEGHAKQVLSGNDWSLNRPWIVVIEAARPAGLANGLDQWEPIILDAGYRLAYTDGLNRFYVAAEHEELLPAFSSPPSVSDEFIAASQSDTESRLQNLEDRARHAKTLEALRAQQVVNLERELQHA